MKVCIDCYRVNEDNAEEYIGCGFSNFRDVVTIEEDELPAPFYDSAEEYEEVDNG